MECAVGAGRDGALSAEALFVARRVRIKFSLLLLLVFTSLTAPRPAWAGLTRRSCWRLRSRSAYETRFLAPFEGPQRLSVILIGGMRRRKDEGIQAVSSCRERGGVFCFCLEFVARRRFAGWEARFKSSERSRGPFSRKNRADYWRQVERRRIGKSEREGLKEALFPGFCYPSIGRPALDA